MIITFANQKGGVGKSTLCALFSNYLASKDEPIMVLDCDNQQTISEIRNSDQRLYSEVRFPYNVQAFNIVNESSVVKMMTKARQLDGSVVIDAPGNLMVQGIYHIFANSDIIVCPYEQERGVISSTSLFTAFILRICKTYPKRNIRLFFIVNKHDKRKGTKEELTLFSRTEKLYNTLGKVLPKLGNYVELTRYNTFELSSMQEKLIAPVFAPIYNEILNVRSHGKEE